MLPKSKCQIIEPFGISCVCCTLIWLHGTYTSARVYISSAYTDTQYTSTCNPQKEEVRKNNSRVHEANHPRDGQDCFSSGTLTSKLGEMEDCQQVAYIKKRLQKKRKRGIFKQWDYGSNIGPYIPSCLLILIPEPWPAPELVPIFLS